MGVDISTEVCGLKLRNPLILTSGVLDLTGSLMRRAVEGGAGAVVTKGIGPGPKKGHPNPTVIATEHFMMNAVGLSNPGVDKFKDEIDAFREMDGETPVIANIFGKNLEEFAEVAEKVSRYDVDALEVNISCPNVSKGGATIGIDPVESAEVTEKVIRSANLPVFVKLTPNVTDIGEIAKAVEKAGASGISAINTVGPGMVIEPRARKPVLYNKFGGVSGPGIKPIAVASVYKIRQAVDIPVIGVGGVKTGRDAVEMMMAGASAVAIGSAVYYEGIDVFEKVGNEIKKFMEKEGYNSLNEIIGAAHG